MHKGMNLFSAPLDRAVNVSTVPQRSPFRYPGGKTWLVPHVRTWLANLGFRPVQFVEPFAGGGIIGLSVAFEDLADKVLLVEKDERVASVWESMLNGGSEKLAERILDFECTVNNVKRILGSKGGSAVDSAFRALLRNRVQHGGIMAPGASLTKNGENGKGISSRWYPETLAKRIRNVAKHSDRIRFVRGDGFDCIRRHYGKTNTVFFIDPPYTVAGRRLYTYSDIDNASLFDLVSKAQGPFLMTYDETEEIKSLARTYSFQTARVVMMGRLNIKKRELLISRDLNWALKSKCAKEVPA